jgi:DNA-binding LytR/AlgR family response regulator
MRNLNAIDVSVEADATRLTGAVLAVVVVGFGVALLQRGLMMATFGGGTSGSGLISFELISWAPWLLLAPIAVIAARQWPVRTTPRIDLLRHAGAAGAIAVAHAVATSIGLRVISGPAPSNIIVRAVLGLLTWRLAIDLLVYVTIVGIVLAIDREARVSAQLEAPSNESLLPSASLAFQDGERSLVFRADELIWLEGADDYARLHARGRTWLIRETLSTLEGRLQTPPFFRVHRSRIVNLWHVTMIKRVSRHRHSAVMRDGSEVPVSAPQRRELEAWLLESSTARAARV